MAAGKAGIIAALLALGTGMGRSAGIGVSGRAGLSHDAPDWMKPNRGKYSGPPHSHARENARRRRQIEKGMLRVG